MYHVYTRFFLEVYLNSHIEVNDSEEDCVVIVDTNGNLLHTTLAGALWWPEDLMGNE